jgi:hypothetical protein
MLILIECAQRLNKIKKKRRGEKNRFGRNIEKEREGEAVQLFKMQEPPAQSRHPHPIT